MESVKVSYNYFTHYTNSANDVYQINHKKTVVSVFRSYSSCLAHLYTTFIRSESAVVTVTEFDSIFFYKITEILRTR